MFWLYTNVMSMVFARKGNDNQSRGQKERRKKNPQQMMARRVQEIEELRVGAVNFLVDDSLLMISEIRRC